MEISGSVGLVFALLLLIALGFVLRFVLPAIFLLRDLRRATLALERIQQQGAPVVPARIAAEAMTSPRLARAWREYAQTLHTRATEGRKIWRSTVMAETFLSVNTLVETPLKTEFYKHLPGILTGIGIIGTFAGLIAGLTQFEVNSDTESVRQSLRQLIQGVGHAFQVSALAITLAMLTTWIEKSLTTLGFRRVARLNELIDGLFEGGVEEEYLERLVLASEASARQSEALAQTLSTELRQSLGVWTQQQQQMAARQQELLAGAVANAVGAALRDPLARMAAAMEKAGGSQGEAVSRSLQPVLERWMARVETQWGSARMEGLLTRASEAMDRAAAELGHVVTRLGEVGQGAMTSAVGRLQMAGEGADRAAETFAEASDNWMRAASTLAAAAREAGTAIRAQSENREALALMLRDLRGILENTRRETAVTSDLVARMEAAGNALGHAGLEAGRYLEGVNQVLTEAHACFAENVERTLRQGNAQFHKELAAAIDYLKGAIEALGDTLETLASRE
ncbi:MAG: hypothetical protein LBO79_05625 [Zoogloeaceae bacterium]|jgi:hypothetical protein|nr:hypothetical protein [Zoogloeaceae bacterium]